MGVYNTTQISQLRGCVNKKMRKIGRRNVFSQDNTPVHKSYIVMAAIQNAGFEIQGYSAYPSGSAPSDYFWLTKLKGYLRGTRYNNNSEVMAIPSYRLVGAATIRILFPEKSEHGGLDALIELCLKITFVFFFWFYCTLRTVNSDLSSYSSQQVNGSIREIPSVWTLNNRKLKFRSDRYCFMKHSLFVHPHKSVLSQYSSSVMFLPFLLAT